MSRKTHHGNNVRAEDNVIREWILYREKDIPAWAAEFSDEIFKHSIILFRGNMGSGKTTLIRHLLEAIGGDEVSSPTFSIVNEYGSPHGDIYHFDLYRLEKEEELEEIGFEEYLDSGHLCLIEWPELGQAFYPPDSHTLSIEVLDDNKRKIQMIKGIAL